MWNLEQMKTKFRIARKKKNSIRTRPNSLFSFGYLILITLGITVLSRTDGMGHHLGHAGFFF